MAKKWLMKPFSNRGRLSPQKRRFNEKLSAMRSVIERAFGLLKGRWRLLLKKIEQSHTSVPRSVTAAFVLHNFCVMQGDSFDDDNNPHHWTIKMTQTKMMKHKTDQLHAKLC